MMPTDPKTMEPKMDDKGETNIIKLAGLQPSSQNIWNLLTNTLEGEMEAKTKNSRVGRKTEKCVCVWGGGVEEQKKRCSVVLDCSL